MYLFSQWNASANVNPNESDSRSAHCVNLEGSTIHKIYEPNNAEVDVTFACYLRRTVMDSKKQTGENGHKLAIGCSVHLVRSSRVCSRWSSTTLTHGTEGNYYLFTNTAHCFTGLIILCAL